MPHAMLSRFKQTSVSTVFDALNNPLLKNATFPNYYYERVVAPGISTIMLVSAIYPLAERPGGPVTVFQIKAGKDDELITVPADETLYYPE